MASGGSSRQRRNRAREAAQATGAAEAGAVAQNSSGTTTGRARASSCCGWQGAKGDREATAGTVGSEQLLGSGGSGGCGKAELLWVAKGYSTYRVIGKQQNTAMTGTVGSEQLLGSGGSGGCGKAELLWVAKGEAGGEGGASNTEKSTAH